MNVYKVRITRDRRYPLPKSAPTPAARIIDLTARNACEARIQAEYRYPNHKVTSVRFHHKSPKLTTRQERNA